MLELQAGGLDAVIHPEMGGICQYHADTLPRGILHKALRTHRDFFISETLSMINPHFLERGTSSDDVGPFGHDLDRFLDHLLDQSSLNDQGVEN